MLNFLRELKRLFENDNYITYDFDEDVIGQYYFSRKQIYPCLSVEIVKLPHNLTAMLCIEIEWNMYYSFAFTEVDKKGKSCEYVKTDRVMKEYPEVYNTFTEMVYNVMGTDGEKTENTIYWDYLYDDKNRQFDFKNFSTSCSDLTSNYSEQAKRIYDMLSGYIKSIVKDLNL